MSSQESIKPARIKLDLKGKDLSPNIRKNDEAREHDGSLPSTPSKTPTEERVKPSTDREKDEISNETILEAILNLERRVDGKLADLSEQSHQSSTMIASLTKR